jgi:hypothetical protein
VLAAYSKYCINQWKSMADPMRRVLAFCTLYTLLGFGMLVAASSKWDWGEFINARHIIQYGPFISVMCAVTTLPSKALRSRSLIAAFGTLLIFSVSTRAYNYYHVVLYDGTDRAASVFTRRFVGAAEALSNPLSTVQLPAFDFSGTNSTDYVCSNHDHALLVSNVGFLYDRTAWENRAVRFRDPWDESVMALKEIARHSRGRAVIAVMVGPKPVSASKFERPPLFTPAMVADAQSIGWSIVRNEPGGIVATRPGTFVTQ